MTNTGGTPAGWYHAPGDAEGTQRYWDGAQWIGEPQTVQAGAAAPDPDATVRYTPTPDAPPGYSAPPAAAPPAYQAPDAGFGQGVPQGTPPGAGFGAPGAPAGYQAFGGAQAVGVPAEWVDRLVAYLIDIAPLIAAYILFFVAAAISDVLGLLMLLVLFVGGFAYFIWNMVLEQGKTGQTIGKKNRGIKLVSDETGQPLGGGMVFVRYLVAQAISFFTCGIAGLLDYLWPLWDSDKKRLTDKILKNSVVKV